MTPHMGPASGGLSKPVMLSPFPSSVTGSGMGGRMPFWANEMLGGPFQGILGKEIQVFSFIMLELEGSLLWFLLSVM